MDGRRLDAVRLDLAVARSAWYRYATYRAATVAGIVTNTFFGVLLTSLTLAVVRQRPVVSGYDEQDLVTQVWIGQGLLMVIVMWSWSDIADRVRSGDIAVDLYRPVDLQRWWYAHDVGRSLFQLMFRGTVPFVIGSFLFDLSLPHRWWTVPMFFASVMAANTVSFGLRFLVNLTAFWILDARGVLRLSMAVWTVFSGNLVSLALFPDRLERIARWSPFAALFQMPVDVWLERPERGGGLGILAVQVVWAMALLAVGRVVLRRATRVAVVQGG
ncbi:MAG: ABC-2 family transporter protein [Ilumatobacteraceae bacterium]